MCLMLTSVIIHILILGNTIAEEISGVFISFDSLTFSHPRIQYNLPNIPTWTAVLSWELDGSEVEPYDTFTLTLPCVYDFLLDEIAVELEVDDVVYAFCLLNSGEAYVPFSTLDCTILDELTPETFVEGTISLPLTFNVGGSGFASDLESSTCFTEGENTVTFLDGENELSIETYFDVLPDSDPDDAHARTKYIPSFNRASHYLVLSNCPNGYNSGTIGFSLKDPNQQIDCAYIHFGVSDRFNDWLFPTKSDKFDCRYECTPSKLMVYFTNIKPGFRPFLDALVKVPPGVRFQPYNYVIYECTGSSTKKDDSFTRPGRAVRDIQPITSDVQIFVTTRT
ncbi:hypothetical protein G210_0310, partial [Candida maltosa Xu316]